MWEEIFKFLNDHAPFLGVAIILIAITIYLTSKYFHWAHRVEKTEEHCKRIDNDIVPQLKDINGSINSMNTSFKVLVTHLQSKVSTFDARLFFSQSPIRLTPLGLEILKVIGGDKYIDENEKELLHEMDLQGVRTSLDTQLYAPIVITKVSSNSNFRHIKDFIFNNPFYISKEIKDQMNRPYDVEIDMNKIAQLMGIYLRDKYLNKHPELNPEDIPDIQPNI